MVGNLLVEPVGLSRYREHVSGDKGTSFSFYAQDGNEKFENRCKILGGLQPLRRELDMLERVKEGFVDVHRRLDVGREVLIRPLALMDDHNNETQSGRVFIYEGRVCFRVSVSEVYGVFEGEDFCPVNGFLVGEFTDMEDRGDYGRFVNPFLGTSLSRGDVRTWRRSRTIRVTALDDFLEGRLLYGGGSVRVGSQVVVPYYAPVEHLSLGGRVVFSAEDVLAVLDN